MRENGTGAGVRALRRYDERDCAVPAGGIWVADQAARVTEDAEAFRRPVTRDWSAPHQQVKVTTMPLSVFVNPVTWVGKISWRLAQVVQTWSNMVTSLEDNGRVYLSMVQHP